MIEENIKMAVEGDKMALEKVVIEIQGLIYNLALRMLWHPEEAEDATQEVLIKIITNLGSFQHKSSFKTWVYRLASNTLINYKKRIQRQQLSFDKYATYLNQGFSDEIHYTPNEAERKLLIIEAKVGCSNAMLQCLNPESRMVYIVGEILEFNSQEGAFILDTNPVNFRKKLSRARARLHSFLNNNCGIVNPANKCRCYKKVDHAIQMRHIDPKNLLFTKGDETERLMQDINTIQSEVNLYQTNPDYQSPEKLLGEVKRIITANIKN